MSFIGLCDLNIDKVLRNNQNLAAQIESGASTPRKEEVISGAARLSITSKVYSLLLGESKP